MALRSAKCHFVSKQQMISSIARNRYCFNYRKETRHVDANNINSEMSNGCFCTSEALCGTKVLPVLY